MPAPVLVANQLNKIYNTLDLTFTTMVFGVSFYEALIPYQANIVFVFCRNVGLGAAGIWITTPEPSIYGDAETTISNTDTVAIGDGETGLLPVLSIFQHTNGNQKIEANGPFELAAVRLRKES